MWASDESFYRHCTTSHSVDIEPFLKPFGTLYRGAIRMRDAARMYPQDRPKCVACKARNHHKCDSKAVSWVPYKLGVVGRYQFRPLTTAVFVIDHSLSLYGASANIAQDFVLKSRAAFPHMIVLSTVITL